MRFSLAFLLTVMAWVSVLLVAIAATLRLPQNQAESAGQVVSFIVILWMAYAVIGFLNDSANGKAYWSGFAVTSVFLLFYFQMFMPKASNGHLFFELSQWVFYRHQEATGIPATNQSDYTYAKTLSTIFAYWLFPVLSHIGGLIGLRFSRRRHTESQQQS